MAGRVPEKEGYGPGERCQGKRPAAGQRQERALQRHWRHRICFSQRCAAAAEVPTRYRFCGHTVRVHQAIRLQQLAVLVCQLPASAVGAIILEEGASGGR